MGWQCIVAEHSAGSRQAACEAPTVSKVLWHLHAAAPSPPAHCICEEFVAAGTCLHHAINVITHFTSFVCCHSATAPFEPHNDVSAGRLPAAAEPRLDSDLGQILTAAAGPHLHLHAGQSLTAAAAAGLTSLVYLSSTVARSSSLWVGKPVSET